MHNFRKQRGMTMWGLVMVAALIIFFTLLFLKLSPPYLEHVKVKTSLRNVAKQLGGGPLTRRDIQEALQRRFDIEDISRVNLNKDLHVEKRAGAITIRIAYEVRVPLAYNISALLEFDETEQVAGN